jgi:glycosyltransferase involved in cell wall biosynthesis
VVFDRESRLLREHGIDVIEYTRSNDEFTAMNPLQAAAAVIWNHRVYREIRQLIRQRQPDVMHCTNLFPLLSPAVYRAARAEGLPVVQSVHNFRPAGCINGLFLREGQVCENCLGRSIPLPGIRHRCYRSSLAASTAVAASFAVHHFGNTKARCVDRWIALTEFAKDKLAEAGIDAKKIVVKPNFLNPVPAVGTGQGGYAAFVGRLSPEKGIETLLEAWKRIENPFPLKILGTGPLEATVRQSAEQLPQVSCLGSASGEQVLETLRDAAFLVFPSILYENFPLSILEAYACGTPVIASRIGNMRTLVTDGLTGYHFAPGDPKALAETVQRALANPEDLARMRIAARERFEQLGDPERNFQQLLSIYCDAIQSYG